MALTGYGFDSRSLFEISIFAAMALHTALAFALLFVALLLRQPGWSWMAIVTADGEGSASVRRLLPAVLILPLFFSWLALRATNMDLLGANFRLSLVAILTMSFLAALLLRNGARLNLAESELRTTLVNLENTVEQRNLLLREVYHRVKNNLQQINALLAIESLRVQDPTVQESFTTMASRVTAMGAVHQMLINAPNPSTVQVDEFLNELCNRLATGTGTRSRSMELAVTADRQAICLDDAIALGLLVNELVTNAIKHAFDPKTGGNITVRYRVSDNGNAVLEIEDNGRGLPSDREFDGMDSVGTTIIHSLVGQLDGKLDIVSTSRGVLFSITLPNLNTKA